MAIFLGRISLGVIFLYAGITKILDPNWSAAGYLNNAKTFPALYHWFASAGNIGWINLVNEWGLTLVGAALILGVLVRWASLGGMLFMVLYYVPVLKIPYVDDHIIYIIMFLIFFASNAGTLWGLDSMLYKHKK